MLRTGQGKYIRSPGLVLRRLLVSLSGVNTQVSQLRITAIASTLRSCQLFAGLPASDLEEIAGFSQPRGLDKGEYLFREGAPGEGFYVVQRGSVNVHRVSPAGKEQVIAIFRTGASFAEASLAGDAGYPADARAIEPTSVILVPKVPFVALLARRPDLALRMLASMSMHLRVLVSLVEDMTLKDVETRLVNWILRRCDVSKVGIQDVPIDSTKRVLAAELSTSSETLSRTFAALREAGLLEVEGNMLRVPEAAALNAHFHRLLGEK